MEKNLPEIDKNNFPIIFKHLTYFIRDEVLKTGINKIVLGLSGGIDSAVACYLAANALGKENVTALLMPYKSSSKTSMEDALDVINSLGVQHCIVDITRQIDGYFAAGKEDAGNNDTRVRIGNKMARERMSVLYDYSFKLDALVLGTSNKSELLLGYGTIYGDMASALNPIGDIYKTQIYQLARLLNVPAGIIEKAPSADLWLGQSDESELGFTYKDADSIMYLLIDKMYKPAVIASLGYDENLVNIIYNKIKKSQYKRRLPLIAKISERTINIDFRYLRDWS